MLRLQHTTATTIATATTTAILAGIGGYLLGQARRSFNSSDPLFGRGRRARSKGEPSSSDEEEDESGGLSDFKGGPNEEYKLVLVVRTDLGMTRGLFGVFLSALFTLFSPIRFLHGCMPDLLDLRF